MRRWMLALLLGLVFTPLMADAFQVCWRLRDGVGNPSLDVIRVSATQKNDTNPVIFEIHASWVADPLYHMGGAGIATQDVLQPQFYRLAITATHDTTFFGNNRLSSLTALLVADPSAPNYLNGTWSSQSAGTTTPFSVSGLITFFECPVFSPAFAQMQETVEAEQRNAFGEVRAAGIGQLSPLRQGLTADRHDETARLARGRA